jgi:hypothetical protein
VIAIREHRPRARGAGPAALDPCREEALAPDDSGGAPGHEAARNGAPACPSQSGFSRAKDTRR